MTNRRRLLNRTPVAAIRPRSTTDDNSASHSALASRERERPEEAPGASSGRSRSRLAKAECDAELSSVVLLGLIAATGVRFNKRRRFVMPLRIFDLTDQKPVARTEAPPMRVRTLAL